MRTRSRSDGPGPSARTIWLTGLSASGKSPVAAEPRARGELGERFVEVYVKASVEVCARRDPRGLYRRAFAGELTHFTGVSDPYEEPRDPEIVLDTERQTPQQSAAAVLAFLDGRGLPLDEDP